MDKNLDKSMGLKIKKIRQSKDISREDLSKALGISVHTLAKYEQGQREPNIEMIKKISKFLKIDIYEFLYTDSDLKKVVENAWSSLKKKYGNSKSLNQIIWDKTADIYENAPTLTNVFFKDYNDLKYDKEPSAYLTLFQVLAEIYAMELALKAPRDKVISEREECLKILQPKLQDCINDLQDYIDVVIKEKFRRIIDDSQ